nr:hypothetical protein [Rhizobium laguerreae]
MSIEEDETVSATTAQRERRPKQDAAVTANHEQERSRLQLLADGFGKCLGILTKRRALRTPVAESTSGR